MRAGGNGLTPERWIERGLWVAIAVFLPLAALLYLQLPPSIDQWQLDYTGWMIDRGHAPYVDLRDGNWPVSHWLHALSVGLWGPDVLAWRRTDLGLLVLGVSAGVPLVARLGGRLAISWWLLVYPLLYVTSGAWFAGQRDIVAAHLGLAAVTMAWRALEGGARWAVGLSGLALTAAVLIKPTFALFALIVPGLAWHLTRSGALDRAAALRGVLAIAAASVAALGLAIVVLALQGATSSAFWEHAIVGIVTRVPNDSVPVGESLLGILAQTGRSWHWLSGGAVLATLVAIRSGEAAARTAVGLGWSIVAVGVVSHLAQGHNLAYYLGPVMVGLSVLLAGGLAWASRSLSSPGPPRFVAALLLALATLGVASKLRGAYGELIPVWAGARERATWESRFFAGDGLSLAQAREVAAELAAAVPPDGTLLVWGRANVLNLLASRPQPTGFYHPPHFQREFLPGALFARWEEEFIADLERHRPEAAWVREVHAFGNTRSSRFLERWLAERYVAGRALGDGRIFRRADAIGAAQPAAGAAEEGARE